MATRKEESRSLKDDESNGSDLDPIELIEEFLNYFDLQEGVRPRGPARLLKSVKSVSPEVLEGLAERFAMFLLDGVSLEKAFGGGTGRGRQRLNIAQKALLAGAKVKAYQNSGDKFEVALEKTAKELNTSVANVKKFFTKTAPPWDRKKGRILRKK